MSHPVRVEPATPGVAVLLSGSGSNLQALLDDPDLAPHVALVVSDRPGAGGLARAERAGVAAEVVDYDAHPGREGWAEALVEVLERAEVGAVVLAGLMRILPGWVTERWPMLNVHPSLLPAFPGAHAVRDALEHGVKVTGATIHLVDEQVDHGPIVAQRAVAVDDDDDVASLHARVQQQEHALLPQAVRWLCEGRLEVEGRRVRVVR